MNTCNICAVTVTYGNRIKFLRPVLLRLTKLNLLQIVVVDNGASNTTKKALQNMKEIYPQLTTLKLENNSGSAKGFKTGIAYAQQQINAEYIFILDDDNLPDLKAIDFLMTSLKLENYKNSCVLALRIKREPYASVSLGLDPSIAFPYKDSFFSFDLFAKIKSLFFRKKMVRSSLYLPYAPYGGLLFHKDLINSIGYPREDFFLYGDDHEYTARIVAKGGKIKLVPEAIIKDIDLSWHSKDQISTFDNYFSEDEDKIFYTVRNRTFVENTYRVKNRVRYLINLLIYIFVVFLFSFKHLNYSRFLLFFRAVNHGIVGNFSVRGFKN